MARFEKTHEILEIEGDFHTTAQKIKMWCWIHMLTACGRRKSRCSILCNCGTAHRSATRKVPSKVEMFQLVPLNAAAMTNQMLLLWGQRWTEWNFLLWCKCTQCCTEHAGTGCRWSEADANMWIQHKSARVWCWIMDLFVSVVKYAVLFSI